MLVVSLFLTGFLGVLQERTYKQYGPCWREGVFYTVCIVDCNLERKDPSFDILFFKHFLSLPIFLFLVSDIKQGFWSLSTANGSATLASFLILGSNLVSQLVCVSGVNRLSSVRPMTIVQHNNAYNFQTASVLRIN